LIDVQLGNYLAIRDFSCVGGVEGADHILALVTTPPLNALSTADLLHVWYRTLGNIELIDTDFRSQDICAANSSFATRISR
jgi:hypothetical protein